MTMRALILSLGLPLTAAACAGDRPAETPERPAGSASAAAPAGAGSPADTVSLGEARVPDVAAGDPRGAYRRTARADLDGDGAAETAVVVADVSLDARGKPLWEDGHRWQLHIEEGDGTRTRAYARFLPMGKLEPRIARGADGAPPTILLLEVTPHAVGAYELRYDGPRQVRVVHRLVRELGEPFTGSPAP